MTTNLFEHLINLKVLSDYRKSELDSIELFWDAIRKGYNPAKDKLRWEETKHDVTDEDRYDPTEEEIEQSRINREIEEQRDYFEEYIESIREELDFVYKCSWTSPPEKFELNSVYSEYIERNSLLMEYLNIEKALFINYSRILGKRAPDKFFKILKDSEQNEGFNHEPIENTRIFNNHKAEQIFERLHESMEKNMSNLSFIYRILQRDQYIYEEVGPTEFLRWYDDQYQKWYEKLKTLNSCSTQEKLSLYNTVIESVNSSKIGR